MSSNIVASLPASGPLFLALRANMGEDLRAKLDEALAILVTKDLQTQSRVAAPFRGSAAPGAAAQPLPDYKDAIVCFQRQTLLSPRGTYEVRLFEDCLVAHGKFNKSAHERGAISYPPGVSAPFGAVRVNYSDVHSILYLQAKNRQRAITAHLFILCMKRGKELPVSKAGSSTLVWQLKANLPQLEVAVKGDANMKGAPPNVVGSLLNLYV